MSRDTWDIEDTADVLNIYRQTAVRSCVLLGSSGLRLLDYYASSFHTGAMQQSIVILSVCSVVQNLQNSTISDADGMNRVARRRPLWMQNLRLPVSRQASLDMSIFHDYERPSCQRRRRGGSTTSNDRACYGIPTTNEVHTTQPPPKCCDGRSTQPDHQTRGLFRPEWRAIARTLRSRFLRVSQSRMEGDAADGLAGIRVRVIRTLHHGVL